MVSKETLKEWLADAIESIANYKLIEDKDLGIGVPSSLKMKRLLLDSHLELWEMYETLLRVKERKEVTIVDMGNQLREMLVLVNGKNDCIKELEVDNVKLYEENGRLVERLGMVESSGTKQMLETIDSCRARILELEGELNFHVNGGPANNPPDPSLEEDVDIFDVEVNYDTPASPEQSVILEQDKEELQSRMDTVPPKLEEDLPDYSWVHYCVIINHDKGIIRLSSEKGKPIRSIELIIGAIPIVNLIAIKDRLEFINNTERADMRSLNEVITKLVGEITWRQTFDFGKSGQLGEDAGEFDRVTHVALGMGANVQLTFVDGEGNVGSYVLDLVLSGAERISRLMSKVRQLRISSTRKFEADRYDNVYKHLNDVMAKKWNQENPKQQSKFEELMDANDAEIENRAMEREAHKKLAIDYGVLALENAELQRKLAAANVTLEELGKMAGGQVGSVIGLGGIIVNSVQRELDGKILRIEVNGQMMIPAVKSEVNASLNDAKEDANNIETLMNTNETLNNHIGSLLGELDDLKKKNADYVAANLRLETLYKEKSLEIQIMGRGTRKSQVTGNVQGLTTVEQMLELSQARVYELEAETEALRAQIIKLNSMLSDHVDNGFPKRDVVKYDRKEMDEMLTKLSYAAKNTGKYKSNFVNYWFSVFESILQDNLLLRDELKQKPNVMVGWSRDLDECRKNLNGMTSHGQFLEQDLTRSQSRISELEIDVKELIKTKSSMSMKLEEYSIECVSLQNQLNKMRDRAESSQARVRELEDVMAKWTPSGSEDAKMDDGTMIDFKSVAPKKSYVDNQGRNVFQLNKIIGEMEKSIADQDKELEELEADMIVLEKENEVLWNYYEMRESEHYDDQEYHKIDGDVKRLVFERIHKLEKILKLEAKD